MTHLSEVVWRHSSTNIFDDAMIHLRRVVSSCSTCCHTVLKWLAADDTALLNLILRCPHQTVRSQIRLFLIDCLKSLRETEPALYGMESMDSDMEADTSALMEGVLAEIAWRLRSVATESYQSTRGWDDLYLTLTMIVEMGHVETAVLLNEGFLVFCLGLFSTQVNQAFCTANSELVRIVEKKRSIFNSLIGFVFTLLSRIDIRLPVTTAISTQNIDRMATLDREQMRFPFTRKERNTLFHWGDNIRAIVVLDKMLELFDSSKAEIFYPGEILKWMLGSYDADIQKKLCETVQLGITDAERPLCDAYARMAISFCEACPITDNVARIIYAAAKAVKTLDEGGDEDEHGSSGEALLYFFAGLPSTTNKVLFEQKHPEIFQQQCMTRSLMYAVPLLLHGHEHIRRSTRDFLRGLYFNIDEIAPETMVIKYDTIRKLIAVLTERTVYEANSGTLRSHLDSMMTAGQMLSEMLAYLTRSQDPELEDYKDENDAALILRWQSEVENRARMWPDEGSPISAGEGAFDNSDYGSESEDVELLDG
jgi:ubiquitin carboxyl-terminal hydrolase 34